MLYEILASSGPCVVRSVKPIPHCDHALLFRYVFPEHCGAAGLHCAFRSTNGDPFLLCCQCYLQTRLLSLVKGTLGGI